MQIFFAVAFPFRPEPLVQAQIEALQPYDGFDAEARQMVECGNALKFFPRIAALTQTHTSR